MMHPQSKMKSVHKAIFKKWMALGVSEFYTLKLDHRNHVYTIVNFAQAHDLDYGEVTAYAQALGYSITLEDYNEFNASINLSKERIDEKYVKRSKK